MFGTITPSTLFNTQLVVLQRTLPPIRDGGADAIHDARVATRRIREVLLLLAGDSRWRHAEDLGKRFRRLGRSLGRVRDADVRVALLALFESRIPDAAPTLVPLRQRRERERLERMRKLIKRLERLDAVHLVDLLADRTAARVPWFPSPQGGRWRRNLRSILASRSQDTLDAIEHATAVYFPNRVHSARIAIKKLRYALEMANETGSIDRGDAIRELKKTQDMLGDLHDRQDLIDHLSAEADRGSDGSDHGPQVSLVHKVVEAEVRDLHARYVDRRDRVVAICRDVRRTGGAVSAVPPLPAIAGGAVALSSLIYVAHRMTSPEVTAHVDRQSADRFALHRR